MTYPAAFLRAVERVLELEGGFVDDPEDNGGRTSFGISQKAYPSLDIASLTRDDAIAIYFRDYWCAARCDRFPPAVGFVLFDAAVNQGPLTAIRMLQGALRVGQDGVVGNGTIAAAQKAGDALLADFATARIVRYTWHEDFKTFGRGWVRRTLLTTLEAKEFQA